MQAILSYFKKIRHLGGASFEAPPFRPRQPAPLQGDVIGLLDYTGTQMVKYTYDAWGKPASKSGTMKNTLGTVLGLNEYNRKNECLPVTVEYTLYTNPGMLSYLFNVAFAEYVKRIPDEEYMAIMDAVAEALTVTLIVKTEKDDSAAAEISELQARCAEIAAMAAERDKCKAEMHAAQSVVEEVRAQRDTYAQKLATAENAAPDMYKGLYYELLDRILQRG